MAYRSWKLDESDYGVDSDGHRSANIVWVFEPDNPAHDEEDVLSNCGIVQHETAHPANDELKAREFDGPYPFEGTDAWTLSVDYSTKREKQDDGDDYSSLVKVGHETADIERPALWDAFGNCLTNAADSIIDGLKRTDTLHIYPVRAFIAAKSGASYIAPPSYLTKFTNFVNSDEIKISQVGSASAADVWGPGTAIIKGMSIGEEPVEQYDAEFWEVTFQIVCDPDGHSLILPNRGYQEYRYKDSAGAAIDPWTYNPASGHKKTRHNIGTDDGESMAEPSWLDAWGRAVKAPVLNTTSIGNGAMAKGGKTLTLTPRQTPGVTGAGFSQESHEGAGIVVTSAGHNQRRLHTRIKSVTNSSTVEVETAARAAVTGVAVYLPGVIVREVMLQQVAAFTGTIPGVYS